MAQHALRFDGADDFVSVKDTGGFDFDSAFTVEAWVRPFSLEGNNDFKAIVRGVLSDSHLDGSGWVLFLEGDDPLSVWHNNGRLGSSPDSDANDPSWEASTGIPLLPRFLRCDPNDDGKTDVADGVWILNELFRGGAATACAAAADCNGDGGRDISDGLYAIFYQFTGGPSPPAPFPDCGSVDVPPGDCPSGSTICP
jgi:hypothetical protein